MASHVTHMSDVHQTSFHLRHGLLGESHVVDRDCITPGEVLTGPGQERLREKET